MKKGYLFSILLFAGLSAFWLTIPSGCANIIPPAGGPRDSIPPLLVDAMPADSTLNFRGNRITLIFDEYVDLQDIQNNILFTPSFNTNPEISVKARNVSIRFRDTLENNTTYILNFGNAIKDINEGNVLHDFTYTFSTGPVLDSLEISGRVQLAETGGVDTTLIAVLHRNMKDSAVMNEKPRYIAKVDNSGNFHFRNLPKGTFALYVIGDAGLGRRYMNRNQVFGFLNQPVVSGEADSVLVYAYRETQQGSTTQAQQAQAPRLSPADRRLRITPVNGSIQDLKGDYVINFPIPLRTLDTTRIRLSTDSTFEKAEFKATLDSAKNNLTIRSAWKEGKQYNLVLEKDFAADTAGRQLLKTDTITFVTKKLADYANITLRLRNLDSSLHPVLLFIQNNAIVYSVPMKGNLFSEQMFTPGEYDLRILYDRNGNGKWDPGHFFGDKSQPELVRPIDRKITVKPAWDNEFDIQL
jgi:uncharacterized protein (DUF2141 family)